MPLPFDNLSNKGMQVPLALDDTSSKDKQVEEDFSKWPIPDEYTIYYIDSSGEKQKSEAQDPRYIFMKLNNTLPKLSDKTVAELKASKTTPRTLEVELGLRQYHQSRTEGQSIESPLSIDDDDDGNNGNAAAAAAAAAAAGNHPPNKANTNDSDTPFGVTECKALRQGRTCLAWM
jgi:hypothetical protein